LSIIIPVWSLVTGYWSLVTGHWLLVTIFLPLSKIIFPLKPLHSIFGVLAWILSRTPLPILHLKANAIGFILYHIVGYRKKVVMQNLQNSFPEKTEQERKSIARKYYRNIADIIVEVIKTGGISPKELKRRMVFTNYEVMHNYIRQGRSVILITGHLGNWEWLGTRMTLETDFLTCAVVKPLSDPWFDDFMNNRRMRFQPEGKIDFRWALKDMIKVKDRLSVTFLAGDQTPTKNEINYWITFLNQDTPVYLGVEKISKMFDRPVIFTDIQRTRRGYYEVSFTLITDTPKETRDEEITEKHVHLLEETIRKNPDNWLWSHRRWKHKREK